METVVENKSFYSISIRFFHPSMDPIAITKMLNLQPDLAWKAGETAKTPRGGLLSYKNKTAYWYYSTDTDGRRFGAEIDDIAEYLSPHRAFLHRFVAEGGRAEIYLQLPGSVNVGDTIQFDVLSKLADIKVELSIEVFPHMQRKSPEHEAFSTPS